VCVDILYLNLLILRQVIQVAVLTCHILMAQHQLFKKLCVWLVMMSYLNDILNNGICRRLEKDMYMFMIIIK